MGNGWSLENQAKLLNSFVSKLPYVVFYNLKPITKSPRKKKTQNHQNARNNLYSMLQPWGCKDWLCREEATVKRIRERGRAGTW